MGSKEADEANELRGFIQNRVGKQFRTDLDELVAILDRARNNGDVLGASKYNYEEMLECFATVTTMIAGLLFTAETGKGPAASRIQERLDRRRLLEQFIAFTEMQVHLTECFAEAERPVSPEAYVRVMLSVGLEWEKRNGVSEVDAWISEIFNSEDNSTWPDFINA